MIFSSVKIVKSFIYEPWCFGRTKFWIGLGEDGELYRGLSKDDNLPDKDYWVSFYEAHKVLSLKEMMDIVKQFGHLLAFL